MKRTVRLAIMALVGILAIAALAFADMPDYHLASGWAVDPVFTGKTNPNVIKNAQPGDYIPGYWYRNTHNQNGLWDHTVSQYLDQVLAQQVLPGVWVVQPGDVGRSN